MKRNMLLLRHYWHRIGGAAMSWFVWDFAFYGEWRTPDGAAWRLAGV